MEVLKLEDLRHSAAHLLAAAVKQLWPNVKLAIGPAIESGFYYDFNFGGDDAKASSAESGASFGKIKISEEDLLKIEKKMREILPAWGGFKRIEVSPEEARKEFRGNPYKLELIDELVAQKAKITIYQSGDFRDLCRGGHIANSKTALKNFKLLSIAGAYWRGNEKNPMLTRIYGTIFPTQKELKQYLEGLEAASENDHRKIGKELGLFVFSDLIGKGLPLLTAKGSTIRRVLERFIVDEEIKRGYQHVYSPPLARTELYKKSGHYPYYKNTMYPVMQVDDEELILRPMTCPHHFMLYKSELHSYKDLPLRIAEISPQFRYEKSGELTGLIRIRVFNLADAHIFTTPEQAGSEIKGVLGLIDYSNKAMGLTKGEDYRYRLSLGDRSDSEKYYKDDKAWDYAEGVLRKVLKETNAPFYEAEGEAAFYGPKIDVQIKRLSGKEETAFTVQYDFVMPKRFDLTYIDATGKEKELVVIHRASIGCLERTMAFLIEKYHGNFPVWLAPIQATVIPISEKFNRYGQEVRDALKDRGIRVWLDERGEKMQAKIRDAQLQKIPYMLVVGEKEEKGKAVAVRLRTGRDLGLTKLTDFTNKIAEISSSYSLNLWDGSATPNLAISKKW